MPKRSELKITKRAVDALEVVGKDAVFWDRDLAGFGVRVYPTGRKVYVIQSRGPGGLKRKAIGRHGEISTEEARKSAAILIDRIKQGEDPTPAAELNVSGLAERFMRIHVVAHCKPSTAATYRSTLDKHVLPTMGPMKISEVGEVDVMALHHRLRDTPRVADTAVDVLSRMYVLAEAWGFVSPGGNPCHVVRRYRKRSRERFLAPEEFRRLGRVLRNSEADGSVWPVTIAAIRLVMLTGCRKSEILDLRWDDVDLTVGELRLKDAKAGPRMVHLTAPVLAVLEGVPRSPGEARVFPGPRGGNHKSHFDLCWRRIRARAGLDDVRIHDLRHSYASRALALGESLPTIGKLLGHTGTSATARYAHLMRDAEKTAAARVGESIGAHLETQTAED